MKCVHLYYNGQATEWVLITPGRWGLVGQKAEVFFVQRRGWGVMVQDNFLGYYTTRERAMQAALDLLDYHKRLQAHAVAK